MEKEVIIHVKGLQTAAGSDEDPIEIMVSGQYFCKNGNHYLRYEEIVDESKKPTINYVKISDNAIEVRKSGVVNVQMVFEKGKKTMSLYTTPFGTLQMGISATDMIVNKEEHMLALRVDYALDINNDHAADCYIEITARSKSASETIEW